MIKREETPFAQHNASTRTASLASAVWRTRPNKNNKILAKKVQGQKAMFAPVLSGILRQTTRCPCGFGANAGKVSKFSRLCNDNYRGDVLRLF